MFQDCCVIYAYMSSVYIVEYIVYIHIYMYIYICMSRYNINALCVNHPKPSQQACHKTPCNSILTWFNNQGAERILRSYLLPKSSNKAKVFHPFQEIYINILTCSYRIALGLKRILLVFNESHHLLINLTSLSVLTSIRKNPHLEMVPGTTRWFFISCTTRNVLLQWSRHFRRLLPLKCHWKSC